MFDHGSSSSTTEGRGARARASATRCCSAARELVREAVRVLRQADQAEQLRDALAALAAANAEADVLLDAQVREERVLLEDHPDPARVRRHEDAGAEDGAALDRDLAGVGALEARDEAEQRRLPAAARAEQGDELPALDAELAVEHGLDVAEALRHAVRTDRSTGHARIVRHA